MKLKEAAITILINEEKTTIELTDKSSGIKFATVTLTPEQLSGALGRIAFTECECTVQGLENLNKKLVTGTHIFELPKGVSAISSNSDKIYEIGKKTCPEGWVLNTYFGSQGSFFQKDGKQYVRGSIKTYQEDETEL